MEIVEIVEIVDIVDIVDIVALFFKSVMYRHKKVIQSPGLKQSFVRKLLEENNLSPKECI